jgi:RND superfamily putative drug exporter
MDTFLVRTLLVPSTVVLLGRWNWWPSRLTVHHDSLDRTEQNAEPDTYSPVGPQRGDASLGRDISAP